MAATAAAGARLLADLGQYRAGRGVTRRKDDGSPVTDTDRAVEDIVTAAITAVSDHPIIAEEAAHEGTSPGIDPARPFWLVDALDGTRSFIHGGEDFTVNIALIENGEPVFGIIHAPVAGVTWHAAKDAGAHRNGKPITMRPTPADGYTILAGVQSSAPLVLDPFIGAHSIAARLQRQSSLKFGLLAEGTADLYARLGPTYEWDTAAGDIIMREAGGAVLDIGTRAPVVYGKVKKKFENGGFVAGARAAFTIQVP